MAFLIDLGRPGDSIARRCNHVIHKIELGLGRDQEQAIGYHGVRRNLKKLRALLALGRDTIPDAAVKPAIQAAAAIARDLSGRRDQVALAAVLNSIAPHFAAAVINRTKRGLAKLAWPEAAQSDVAPLLPRLHALASAIEGLHLTRLGDAAIAKGFGHCYRSGRRAMKCAKADPSPTTLHEWRKITQRHYRQLQWLCAVEPDLIEVMSAKADGLARALGELQDLHLLQVALERLPRQHAVDRMVLSKWCKQRAAILRSDAFDAGAIVFADRPGPKRRQLRDQWRAQAAAIRLAA